MGEHRKLFLGSISHESTEDTLTQYFLKFGEVIECAVMRDNSSGESKGFAFLRYKEPSSVTACLKSGPHIVDGKKLEVKIPTPKGGTPSKNHADSGFQPANVHRSRPTVKDHPFKVFIGGLPKDATELDIAKHFQQYGEVTDVLVPVYKDSTESRGFGFVTFDNATSLKDATKERFPVICGKQVDCRVCEKRGTVKKNENNGAMGVIFPPHHLASNQQLFGSPIGNGSFSPFPQSPQSMQSASSAIGAFEHSSLNNSFPQNFAGMPQFQGGDIAMMNHYANYQSQHAGFPGMPTNVSAQPAPQQFGPQFNPNSQQIDPSQRPDPWGAPWNHQRTPDQSQQPSLPTSQAGGICRFSQHVQYAAFQDRFPVPATAIPSYGNTYSSIYDSTSTIHPTAVNNAESFFGSVRDRSF